jgi:hypothetical protein
MYKKILPINEYTNVGSIQSTERAEELLDGLSNNIIIGELFLLCVLPRMLENDRIRKECGLSKETGGEA